jgi:hypothetical protein
MKKLPINPPITFTSLPRRSPCHAVTPQRGVGKSGFVNLRVLFGLLVMLAGVFLALLSFGPATTGFAQGTTREQMAVALAQALAIQPPACVPGQEMFNDVPASSPFCPFIEHLARRGITGGCGGGNYCPGSPVSRAQMAVFIFKATEAFHVVGANNTAAGTQALQSLTRGIDNTAIGFQALFSNTEGQENTGAGAEALLSNTTGIQNTANGAFALLSNTEGSGNTATGDSTLSSNTTGNSNTANGTFALNRNTIGDANTANGFQALFNNMTGEQNTANGLSALLFNTRGSNNTANGSIALSSNTSGDRNTADGFAALSRNTMGSDNVALGAQAGANLTTGNSNIDIGNQGVTGESSTIRIGTASAHTRTFIAGINSAMVSGGAVFVNSAGQLGIQISSARFKDEIKPLGKASEAILALRPVVFRYKNEIDPDRTPQFGLVAEEVEKVNPDLVVRDKNGEIYTVRYDAVNAMLLNEFLKEHKTVQELKKEIAVLTASLKEQVSKIQKVSDQIQLRKRAPQLAENNQ